MPKIQAKPKLTPHLLISHLRIWIIVSIILLLLLTIIWVGYELSDEANFPILDIQIQGDLIHGDKQQLRAIAQTALGKNFFLVNLSTLHQQFSDLPWIRQVDIQRRWPYSLYIILTERRAIARWNQHSLLSKQGVLFTPKLLTVEQQDLPQLYGAEQQAHQVWQNYQRINQQLAVIHLRIVQLHLLPAGLWRIQLNNGIVLILEKTALTSELQRFIAVYPQLFANVTKLPKTVDLRYPDGMAVRWR